MTRIDKTDRKSVASVMLYSMAKTCQNRSEPLSGSHTVTNEMFGLSGYHVQGETLLGLGGTTSRIII